MFQMKDVGQKIAKRRKEKNMTQMELADLMGVSFQAVSNWERGNSMPDISKLPELAEWLELSIDELLTDEKPVRLVRHILRGEEEAYIRDENIRPETVADVAPILKPQQTESLLETVLNNNPEHVELIDLISIAPFVSSEFLGEWALKVTTIDSIQQLVGLAPFLPDETLDHMIDKLSDAKASLSSLVPLAPFLSEKALDRLAQGALEGAKPAELTPLAPFLSHETLKKCAEKLVAKHGIAGIKGIAPFL